MKPPRIPRAILGWLAPREMRASLIDDLDEAFRAQITSGSRRSARRWYWRQALTGIGSTIHLRRRVHESRSGRAPCPQRVGHSISTSWQDVRYGLRTLRRSPAFTSVAVIVLALGIGVNTAAFSIVNAAFFRPLHVSKPNELVYLYSIMGNGKPFITDHRDVEFYSKHTEAFAAVTAHWGRSSIVTIDDESVQTQGEFVEANYFDVLGVKAVLGRTFQPDEGTVTSTGYAIVISYDWWVRRFKRDPAVLGKQVRIEDMVFTIVGVTEPGFVGISSPWAPSRFWVTLQQFSGEDYKRYGVGVIGRLRSGVSLAQARAIVDVQSKQMQLEWFSSIGSPVRFGPFKPAQYLLFPAADVRMPFDPTATVIPVKLASAVSIVVSIVLLIAAANIAGMLTARGVTRTSELAIRRALGAGAWRLVRQLLTESILMALAGGAAGLFIAWMLVNVYRVFTPSRFVVDVALDIRVLLFTAAVCVGAGVVVGLAPAMQALKVDILAALGGGIGAGNTKRVRRRLRHAIVIPQVTLALALLVVAGVHTHALMHIEQADLGYHTDDRVRLSLTYSDPTPPRRGFVLPSEAEVAKEAERGRAFYRQVFESVRNLPGVLGIGMTDRLPVYAADNPVTFISHEAWLAGGADAPAAARAAVSPGYLNAMGISLKKGRDFDDRETLASLPVAAVSEGFANRLWPGGEAIGKLIAAYAPDKPNQKISWLQIVAVIGEVDPILHEKGDSPFVYVPLAQVWRPYAPNVVAWGRGDQAALIQQVKRAVMGADPFAEVFSVQTMDQVVGEILYPRRAAAGILLASGLTGLFLASIGLYGVISYSVAQRRREIGIRRTLGADRRSIIALVVREGALVAIIGAIPGTILSMYALRLTSNLVGAVPTRDIATFVLVPIVMSAVILLACIIPARRATQVNPVEVLRG